MTFYRLGKATSDALHVKLKSRASLNAGRPFSAVKGNASERLNHCGGGR